MNYRNDIIQLSEEWWTLKAGKISGTRFGQLISNRENMMIDELANEALDGYILPDDFENEDVIYGRENEELAIDMVEERKALKFERGGVIISELYPNIHMASPDGITADRKIIVEAKCTMDGKRQINRFRKGVEADKMSQIINYFAVSPEVEKVIWASYCGFRPEIPLVMYEFTRGYVLEHTVNEYKTKPSVETIVTIQDKVNEGLAKLPQVESELKQLINKIKF